MLVNAVGLGWQPDTSGCILLLEDQGEKPYAIDRMLSYLRQAGVFQGVRAVLFGDMSLNRVGPNEPYGVEGVIEDVLGDLDVPILSGFPIGHGDNSLTLPLGVEAELDADAGSLALLESPVAE